MVTYSYVQAPIDAEQLAIEVVASGILTPLDYINTSTETSAVDVVFQATLSGTEETTLSGLVADHVAGTCDQHVKIHHYIDEDPHDAYTPPHEHNYISGTTVKFFPKRTMVKGEVTCVDYFLDEALTDLILKVEITYNRDSLGLAVDRTVTRSWYREDDLPHPSTKVTKKIYTINPSDQTKEAKRRRQNIIDRLLLVVLGMMIGTMPGETIDDILTDGRAFVLEFKSEFDTYVDSGGAEIVVTVSGATTSGITGVWLDNVAIAPTTTIRQYMMGELS